MTPEQLSSAIRDTLADLVAEGRVGLSRAVPETVTVERPRQSRNGDYASTVALQLARQAGLPSVELATLIAERLGTHGAIAEVEVAGPGFVNVTLATGARGGVAAEVLTAGPEYGRGDWLAGARINVEFISANPTGPLHLGHTRWAVVGDAIARVLHAAGAAVTREFYVNDRGHQLDVFGASIQAHALGRPVPEDGYHGAYIADLAGDIVAADPTVLELPAAEQMVAFREAGYARQLRDQQRQLDDFGTHFDVWFSERSLHDNDDVAAGLETLRSQGHLYDADGALWMRTTDFGDDKDRVLIRSSGELTYFASDTAYYVDKRRRGFDRCIYLLGADHHGYVGRLRAMAACAGDDPDQTLEVLIGQLVRITRGEAEVKLSRRSGDIITLGELVAEIGVDALRYSLARIPVDSPLTLDVDQITRQSSDNPVYYVQYAHARCASLLRNAEDLGIAVSLAGFDPSLLDHVREADLLTALSAFPALVRTAAELREPHRIARYLEDLAGAYHRFFDACRVLPQGDEPTGDRHRARLVLVAATRTVLATGLDLLGVSAPERM